MRFSAVKKIKREDLKEAPPWINGLIDPLNSFMETVYQTLNSNVTLQENVASFLKEVTYTTPSTYPSGVADIEVMNELKTRAIGLMVMQVYDKTNYVPAPGPVYTPWVENNGQIVISTITGLEASKTYLIRLLVF